MMLQSDFETPSLKTVRGRFIEVHAMDLERDDNELFAAVCGPAHQGLWRYIPMGPFATVDAMREGFLDGMHRGRWMPYIFREPATGEVLGTASYMRIRPGAGSVEIGCVVFSPKLQRTPAATEAMYLMMRHAFDDLGYRRYEWKCNNRNAASKRAAERLGFTFEGVFRQDMVVKGENRDTAWYSIIDSEWPAVKEAFEAWLGPSNFDEDGQQIQPLATLRR